jgi:hypothetical protein
MLKIKCRGKYAEVIKYCKIFPMLSSLALRRENLWGSGCIDPLFLDTGISGGDD